MDILNEITETKKALQRSNTTASANMTTLELLEDSFQVICDKEPTLYSDMKHGDLAQLAYEYNTFIYQIRTVLKGVVEDWYNTNSSYLRGAGILETVEEREDRLEKVHTLLKQRTIIEDFNNINKQDTHDVLFEYDCLLHDIGLLVNGDYKAFDSDMAYSKHVKKEV
ncbi:hypothetical protein A7K95_08475 [Pediococcus parvulus]|uniref:Uncharacterized protein n=1 Tax=Pediococcus parvulus TaxID=54062 RepID=A0AAP5TAE0_9LACO|nr:hypothetical protein [Pediococcus parvulus]MDV7693602.1 hypothetical protein [Pediococcus parvulus]OAD63721.1 hypothetical protein A7K95_08475 [Pediococcus parvulus]